MDEAVVLIVKAPNQQIEDQTIHCKIGWTVKHVKEHLAEVYPNKPRLEDQKLIYSGQLLVNDSTLKDVLRVYDEQKYHTVHLVCSPTKDSYKPSSATASKPPTNIDPTPPGLAEEVPSSSEPRFRGVANLPNPTFSPQPQAAQIPPMWAAQGTYDPAVIAQHMAWMQQAYGQYMAQYMQMMGSGNMMMQVPPDAMNNVPDVAVPPHLRNGPAEPAQNEPEEDVRINRDWLDWFYIMSRTLVLFSIVYFYSSPVRFFFVSTLGLLMYLYQIGFFRILQRFDQQEQQEVAPQAPPPQVPPPTSDNNNITPDGNPQPPPQPQAPSALAVTWAAFTSFFLSLIPEQPDVL